MRSVTIKMFDRFWRAVLEAVAIFVGILAGTMFLVKFWASEEVKEEGS